MTTPGEASAADAGWATGVAAVTLFVDDIDAARTFYTTVFAKPLVHQDDVSAAFDFGTTVVNLLHTAAAPELVDPAPVAAPEAGARMVLTVGVDDVDAVCEQLAALGVKLLNGPMDRPWGIRTASFQDPSGHVWEIAH